MKYFATPEDVYAGRVTDVYFERTSEILKARGVRRKVVVEVMAKALPEDWPWAVVGGMEECADLLATLPVEARSLAEGSVFYPWEPVLVIEGYYEDFGVYETAILGVLCQASGITTAAARCKKAAGDRSVVSFGARRMHPMIAPLIERYAYAGGCDGVSTVVAAEQLGIEPSGTMPHSLCLLLGSVGEAVKGFDEVIDKQVPRVALIDTFGDEKFEAVAAAEAVGGRLAAVRLDTPASRRGDFGRIIEEVRWELDLRGFGDVKIFVSGGIDERRILELNGYVDGYGVGTRIASAPTVDFALDIVEIDGAPIAKRGKESGRKETVMCPECGIRAILPENIQDARCECGGEFVRLLQPLVSGRRRAGTAPSIADIRDRVAAEVADLSLSED